MVVDYAIIGSQALYAKSEQYRPRNLLELDIVARRNVRKEYLVDKYYIYDRLDIKYVEVNDTGWNFFLDNLNSHWPSINKLFSIKASHAEYDIHWYKTMNDVKWFLKSNYILDIDLYKKLKIQWKEKCNTKKHVNINVSNAKLFREHVLRVYHHDSIHLAISYDSIPVYKRLQLNADHALLSKDLFFQLEEKDKLNLCREEIYTIALERYLIPEYTNNPLVAYKRAAKDLVTRMTKNWFPHYIIFNWDKLDKPDLNYLEKFNNNKHLLVKV
jgi:hypothetical protein